MKLWTHPNSSLAHSLFHAKTLFVSKKSFLQQSSERLTVMFFLRGFYSILSCWRGSKCKYFMDPLWSFHTDCQGLESLNSLEIKKRGSGESNHFSTSSPPDLSSLTCAPVWGGKMKTPHPIWQIHMGCEGCIQATRTLCRLNVALQHFIFGKLTVYNRELNCRHQRK